MRAGIMYMGGDSITEKKQARDLIAMSLVGLLLVLAPTIVFGIINPDILSLKIGNLDKLNIGTTGGAGDLASTTAVGQSACLVFADLRAVPAGKTCASQGADWTQTNPTCCSDTVNGMCCGRKPQFTTPSDASHYIFKIAVMQQNFAAGFGGPSQCVQYISKTLQAGGECGTALVEAETQLKTQNKQYKVVQDCSQTPNPLSLAGTPFFNLPTCP
jgi:hypothetical protein